MAGVGGGEKRCLYEVLGISRDATADDIRAAYKRQALQHHPDKAAAAGVPAETATARFQEIVNAYEVLSDARERAWYDSHRSQILFSNPRPSAASSGGDFSASVDDLLPFFSNSVFSGFGDSGKGFYKVFGDLFARIYSMELKFAAAMGTAAGSVRESPVIGNLESDYAQVTAFYGYWMGFCTVLDFAWVEEYESAAGWTRKARRAMEEENKKLRKKARREYNETVRGLAEFVKKRDKRVAEAAAKRRAEEEERKAKEKARKEAEAKEKAERFRAYQEEEWMAVEVEFDDEFEVEESSRKEEELYCVVCSKKFKSEKQWSNHEKSKKHKEKVVELRHAFEKEDNEEEEEMNEGRENVVDDDEVNGVCEELKKKGVIDEDVVVEVVDGLEDDDFDVEEDVLEEMISQKMRRNASSERQQEIEPSSGHDHKDDANDSDQEEPTASSVKKKPRRRAKKEREGNITKTDSNGEAKLKSDSANVDEKQSYKSGKGNKPEGGGKSAPKKDDNSRSKTQSKEKKAKGSMKTPSLGCDTCGETFDSRNKLFAHLGDTGHAALKHR